MKTSHGVSFWAIVLALVAMPLLAQHTNYVISTVAGSGTSGFSGDGGPATSAALASPIGVAVDGAGNLFIADFRNNRIRQVTSVGTIITVAGNGSFGFTGDGGPATSAELFGPYGVAVDSAGNLFVADNGNARVRKVTSAGTITTAAGNGTLGFSGDGGPATSAELSGSLGVAVDSAGNLFIADGYARVRKVTPAGTISTVAGNGIQGFSGDGGAATAAELFRPDGVAVDSAGNLFIADTYNGRIRKVTPAGAISTVAGNGTFGFSGDGGPATSAELNSPQGIAVDGAGNLYIADNAGARIRKVTSVGLISTVAGNGTQGFNGDGAAATTAQLWSPTAVVVDGNGNVFIADEGNNRIRLLELADAGPTISAGGVVNAASYATAAVAPGSIVSVFGNFPVTSPAVTTGASWPTSYDGLSMQVGTVQAPLSFVSSGQVNLQVPWETAGQSQTRIAAMANGQTSPAQAVNIAPFAPGIFAMNGQGSGQGAIVDLSGKLVDASNPAVAGSTYISIYCTGLGPVSNQPASGSASPSEPLAATPKKPTVTVGGAAAQVLFSGLAPGFVGEYQVNALVPAGVAPGNSVPVVVSLGGVSSNTVTIAVAGSAAGGISVQVSPASATVLVGQTQQFSAVVVGAQNTAVTWAVNGITGGNSTVGTISSSGLYSAPSLVPNPPTVTVAGISQADISQSGTVTVSLAYPSPQLTSISPSLAAQGSTDTTIIVAGLGFTRVSAVNFNGQQLATTFISSTQLTAILPSLSLSSSGIAAVSVTTPAPGGGTSSAAQFTVTQRVAAASLVIMGTPVYSGSPSGPWLLSVAATDSSGNPLPNLPITLNSSEGTIAQNTAATESTGALTASITPPSTYSGEVVEVSAVSGTQTAVIDIVFAASSTSVVQQASAALVRRNRKGIRHDSADPSDSTANSSGISPVILGTSNGTAATNLFSGLQSPCTSNQEMGTTVSVDCQSVFSTQQIQVTPYSPQSNKCSTIGTIEGIGYCAGTAGVLVACASPETVAGPLICAGGVDAGVPSACMTYVATEIAQSLASNPLYKAGAETAINIFTLVAQGEDTSPVDAASNLVAVTCNAADALNAANVIQVTQKPSSQSVQLNDTVSFTASTTGVTWSVMNQAYGNSLGTITKTGPATATYTAPSVAPTQNYCTFFSEYYSDSCPVTIVATGSNSADQTLTTLLLSINATDAPPSISSLAPNPVTAGSPAQQLSINGNGFLAGDMVTFNGSERTPTFVSTNQLKISLLASDTASAGLYPVVVTHSFVSLPNGGGSAPANLAVNTAPTPVPPVPSPTSPGTSTDTGATVPSTTPTLEWTGTGATQYHMAISQYPYGTSNVVLDRDILNGGVSSLSVPLGSLQNGMKYRWNIQSYNSAGGSAVSPSLYFTVSAGSTPSVPSPLSPGTSTDTGFTVPTTTPTITWSGSGATTYELAISQSPYGSSNVIYDNNQLSGSATFQPIPAGYLQNGVKYSWNLQATNSAGQSAWSEPFFFTVNTGSGGAPAVPTLLSPGTSSDTGYQVTTTTPIMQWSGSGATLFELSISHSPYGSSNVDYDNQSIGGSASSLAIPAGTLQNGVKYAWNMRAYNGPGGSSWSAPLYFTTNTGSTTGPLSAPGAPTSLSAYGGNGQVGLGWAAPSSTGGAAITSYLVFRGTNSSNTTLVTSGGCANLGAVLNCTDTGLTNGQSYYYTVSAVNSVGQGPASNGVTATPAAAVTVPGAPTSLSAYGGNGQVGLGWEAPSSNGGAAITSYRVFRGTSSSNTALVTSGGCANLGAVLNCTDTGLTNGQSYYYTVSAVNSAGQGPASNGVTATPAAAVTVPGAPTSLSAYGGNGQVGLGWEAPSSNGGAAITSYRVFRGTSSSNTALVTSGGCANLGAVLNCTDTGLTNGQSYYYTASAVNSAGQGPASNGVTATPAAAVTVPGAPTSLSAYGGNGQVGLGWSPPSNNGGASITSYLVFRGTNGSNTAPVTSGGCANLGAVLNCTDTGLANGQSYYYTVSAVNSAGQGPASNGVTATPAAAVTVPGAPTSLSAYGGNGQVGLGWEAPSSNGGAAITSYRVFRGTSSSNTALVTSGGCANLGAVLNCTDTGLTNGQSYYYTVSAVNSAGQGPASNGVTATPAAAVTVPGAPTSLSAYGGNGQVGLGWEAPSSNGGAAITSYRVFRETNSSNTALVTSGGCANLGAVLNCTDTGLTNGQSYYYTVSAVNSAGQGPASNGVTATPAAAVTVPGAPTSLSAYGGNGQVGLGWEAPSSNGGAAITSYRVFRGTSSSNTALVTSGGCANLGAVLNCTDTGLTNGQSYYYTVSAVNSAGQGPASNGITATPAAAITVPGAPTSLSAYGGNGQVGLGWEAPSSNGGAAITSYRVFRGTNSSNTALVTSGGCANLGAVLNCTDTGLTNGQSYYYTVSAVNSAGQGLASNGVTATPAAPVTIPQTPMGLSPEGPSPPGPTVTTQTPTLTWNASPGAQNYSVAIVNISSGATVFTQTVLTPSCTASTLPNGVTYIWSVLASNSAGSSAPSPGVYFTVNVAPTITGISPNPVPGVNGDQPITINGNAFVSGATVTLTSLGVSYPIPASRTTFVSPSQIQISANVTTTPASWTAEVKNPSGQASNVYTFTVN